MIVALSPGCHLRPKEVPVGRGDKARHLIENFFARLKPYRAIATRYDTTARNFLGAIYLAAAIAWLN
ncbi:transposase [Dyella sedimenti]|uniref:transposase n=1 Tax=Dyella sedimenti TaxID=2919947 RepID=UPI003CE50B87